MPAPDQINGGPGVSGPESPGLRVIAGNRLEDLAGRLAGIAMGNPLPPLESETVIVQSTGMQRWLSLQLAARCGVWADCLYPFPNEIVNDVFRAFFPDMPEDRIFDRDIMTWRLVSLLPGKKSDSDFDLITRYIDSHPGGQALYYIAREIADLFDQYLTYRPEMILDWDSGNDSSWQAKLWRELSPFLGYDHPPALRKRLVEIISSWSGGPVKGLPARMFIFAVSYLPPFHTGILMALSRLIPVYFFVLSPTPEYWGDILSPGEAARILRRMSKKETDPDLLHLEGNPLIASLGRMGRDFHEMLTENELYVDPLFTPVPDDSILHGIQADMFSLKDKQDTRYVKSDDLILDKSIRIASCHGPLREVEVLRDYLLDLFNSDMSIQPRDVLVMTPDIESYAPYISAVFSHAAARAIPFELTDRRVKDENPLFHVLDSFLSLPDRRCSVSEILDILDSGILRDAFELGRDDIDLMRSWVSESGIRWGLDVADRTKLGLPPFRENTWSDGLDRLLTGYALPGNDFFNGILPCGAIEGSSARLLGILAEFIDMATGFVHQSATDRTPGAWASFLGSLFGRFIRVEGESDAYAVIRESLSLLMRIDGEGICTEPVPFALVRSFIRSMAGERRSDRPFITGKVTFCAMLPMRSIPFRVICVLGMNDGVFPRANTPSSFNLIATGKPRPGDRSLRDEDRYLFLETLISARDRLFITYTGQSINDNSPVPPSVLVSELVDYCMRSYGVCPDSNGEDGCGVSLSDIIVVRHPLQSFSREYFSGKTDLFSFSAGDYRALLRSRSAREPVPVFFDMPVATAESDTVLDMSDLVSCFIHPARFFLNRRMGIVLPGFRDVPEDVEPFSLDGLSRYSIGTELAEMAIRCGNDPFSFFPVFRARGVLPHGTLGESIFRELAAGVDNFIREVRGHMTTALPLPVPVDVGTGKYRIGGYLKGIRRSGFLFYRYAKLNTKDLLRAWIGHIVMCCVRPAGCDCTTVHVYPEGSVTFRPVENPESLLKSITGFYGRALEGDSWFIPSCSLAYAEGLRKKGDPLKQALKSWEGDEYFPGEISDPYNGLFYRGRNPLGVSFQAVSAEIFDPLLDAMEDGNKK